MAVEPFSASAYRRGGARDDNAWKWVWDPAAKAGRWQLAGGADSGKAAAHQRRAKVTIQQLEEESRKVEDDRSRQLRRENALRIKAREEKRFRAERVEHEKFQAALEERKREMREKRSLITAGPRVKPLDVCFDDVDVPHGRPEEASGSNSERPPQSRAQHGRPAWNAALAPSHQAPRVGFQPASLIPPPPLPQRNPVPPASRGLSRIPSQAASEPGNRQPSAGESRPLLQKANRMDSEIEAALARAEAGIEKARAVATAGSSRPATVTDSLEDIAPCAPVPRIASGHDAFAQGCGSHFDDAADGGFSRQASSRCNHPRGISYFDNRTPVSAPQSDVGSVCGSASGGGAYRRKVDALKGEIEGLRRQGSSAASSRLPSPAASVRSGVSTACSARSTHRSNNNSETPCLVAQRQGKPSSSSSRYSPERARGGGGSRGISRVREGLMRVREQADLMDSLDLDSPAHRRAWKAGAAGKEHMRGSPRVQLPHESLTESLDLSGSGPLSGMQKAQDWLHTAVKSALQDVPSNARPISGAVGRAAHGSSPPLHRPQQLQQPSASRPMRSQARSGRELRPAMMWTKEKAGQPTRQEAWGSDPHEASEVDEEEALLLKSLARLDARLLSAHQIDPAAAYVAACDFVERAKENREVEPVAHFAGAVVRAKPLDHWNRHDMISMGNGEDHEGVWGGSCAAGQDKGLRKIGSAPHAVARDRRTRGAKNK